VYVDCAGSTPTRCEHKHEHLGAADVYFASSSVLKRRCMCAYPLKLTFLRRQCYENVLWVAKWHHIVSRLRRRAGRANIEIAIVCMTLQ